MLKYKKVFMGVAMITLEVIAQAIGIVGMIITLISYQQKKQMNLIICQMLGGGMFIFNFLLLGIVDGVFYIGTVLNVLGVFRCIVFANKKLFRSDNPIWLAVFTALYFGAYAMSFTVFGNEVNVRNLTVELLPVLAMVAGTFAVYMKEARNARQLSLISSPLWLSYDAFAGSLGGIIGESLNLCSIVIGMLRHDIKKREKV